MSKKQRNAKQVRRQQALRKKRLKKKQDLQKAKPSRNEGSPGKRSTIITILVMLFSLATVDGWFSFLMQIVVAALELTRKIK